MRPSIVAGTIVLAGLLAAPALAATVAVPMDEVRIVSFSQPVSTVYVGNPTIADVSMIDAKHAFLLGKAFGTTNMIALNADGKPIVNDNVTVFGQRMGEVTLNKGAQQYTYTCTEAHCEAAPKPGDNQTFSGAVEGQITSHQDMNAKSANAAH